MLLLYIVIIWLLLVIIEYFIGVIGLSHALLIKTLTPPPTPVFVDNYLV